MEPTKAQFHEAGYIVSKRNPMVAIANFMALNSYILLVLREVERTLASDPFCHVTTMTENHVQILMYQVRAAIKKIEEGVKA